MKNRVLNFLKKYYILIILSLIHPIAIETESYWVEGLVSLTALDSLQIFLFYFFCILPIIHIIYGCIAYIATKKILIPIAILTTIYFIRFTIFPLRNWGVSMEEIIVSTLGFALYPILSALVGIVIGAYIDYIVKYIIKVIKKNQN